MRHQFKRVLAVAAVLALSASRPLLSAPQTPLKNDLSRSSFPSATPVNSVVVTKGPAPETFGTASNTWSVATPWDAEPYDSTFTYNVADINGGWGITRTNETDSPWVQIPLHLPAGAVLTKFETNYCVTNGTNAINGWLVVNAKNGALEPTQFLASSGAPGCVVETATLGSPITIDNDANQYFIQIDMGTLTDGSVIFGALRAGYHLQVSPAPGVASFSDVPTSYWAFQYIEALKASGITQGVTPTTYEPESNVTRAQMAVFLAKALGLHWQ